MPTSFIQQPDSKKENLAQPVEKKADVDAQIRGWERTKVRFEDLAILLQQMAAAQKSGISPRTYLGGRAIDVRRLASGRYDKRNFILGGKPTCPELITGLDQLMAMGKTFHEACGYFPNVFDRQFLSIIEGAEEGGKIEESLQRLADQYREKVEIQREIFSALTYPVMLVTCATIVIAIAFLKVIPAFRELYEGLGAGEMGMLTTSLVAVSEFFVQWWIPIGILIIGLPILYFKVLRKIDIVETAEAELLLRIPVINEYIVRDAALSFLQSFSDLRKSGLELTLNFRLALETVGNKVLREALEKAFGAYTTTSKDGQAGSIHTAIAKCHPCFGEASELYPIMQQWSVSGTTQQIDEYCAMLKRRLEITRKRIFDLIPFVTLLIFGPIVGWIVAGLFLPIIELAGKLSK